MSEFKEGVDFSFVIPEDDSISVNVRMNSGEYSGVVVNYGKVNIEEDKDNDQAYLSFEYTVVDNNNMDDLENSLDFKNHIGNILTSIMMKNVEKVDGGQSEVITE